MCEEQCTNENCGVNFKMNRYILAYVIHCMYIHIYEASVTCELHLNSQISIDAVLEISEDKAWFVCVSNHWPFPIKYDNLAMCAPVRVWFQCIAHLRGRHVHM